MRAANDDDDDDFELLFDLSRSLYLSFSFFSLYSPAGRGVMSVAADMMTTQSRSVQ